MEAGIPTDPTTKKKFCLGFSTHGGCPREASVCYFAHKSITNVAQLPWEVRAMLLKLGGHRSQKAVKEDQVDGLIQALREKASKEAAGNRAGADQPPPQAGAPRRGQPQPVLGQPDSFV